MFSLWFAAGWLVLVNIVTFFVFRLDKAQAQRRGARRVPESFLLGLLLLGGIVGGALGMWMRPRHKTRKPLFWFVQFLALLLYGYLFYRFLL